MDKDEGIDFSEEILKPYQDKSIDYAAIFNSNNESKRNYSRNNRKKPKNLPGEQSTTNIFNNHKPFEFNNKQKDKFKDKFKKF